MLTTLASAIVLFIVTNIDDIVVLSLFFARGAGRKGTTKAILLGQYLGFLGILAVSVALGLGLSAILPEDWIRFFGLIPLAIGLWAAWEAFRGEDDDDVSGKKLSVAAVAGVTFANGGDNIGVYLPVFTTSAPADIAVYCVVFLVLVAGLVAAAKFVATRPAVAEALEKWESVLFPTVLILLGLAILFAV
ncbi:cadmium resistance transporter [Corynebacterium accolens]|uniref:cadmium resistance transporter n=1 Tax=Corynebacterium accolens TaxID=38284 RepID=UPI00254FFFED|nr:cadmium resistance transporter [Corynebacterium accolens]MDK8678555.1 cadmium resistance transporter [Corynebacterium accolens]